MSEGEKGSKDGGQEKRTSKAALRNESFSSVRSAPMRARPDRKVAAGGKARSAPPKVEASAASGPDYLGAMQAYRGHQRSKAMQRSLVPSRWTPIGPSAVRKGQANNKPVTSGRVSSLAVAPGGTRIYAGSANGGVWRSEDAGDTWTPLMEAFDLNPQTENADSLAVGALALVAGETAAEDTLYVGSGEAITAGTNPTGGPMFGVGPIVSTDGGENWQTEPGSGGASLVGSGFFDLAVDPAEPTRVLGATLAGLFLREPDPLSVGDYRWRHVILPGIDPATAVTSVVVAQAPGSGSTFYAGCFDGPVFRSDDGGETWSPLPPLPPAVSGRVRLAVEKHSPEVVYLFSADFSLYRFVSGVGSWVFVRQLEPGFTGSSAQQVANVNGSWNLAIAVEPGNVNRVYLGGGASKVDGNGWLNTNFASFDASIFRCDVDTNPSEPGTLHYIGGGVHADVHAIVFPPDDPQNMWVGCDGGVFHSTNPPGDDGGLLANSTVPRFYFEAKNTGLQTLMMHHLGQHPTEEAVLFSGTQDNGCLRFTGEAAWLHVHNGDCGWVVINPEDPYKVLAGLQFDSENATPLLRRSNFGGNLGSFGAPINAPTDVSLNTLFYYPLGGPPPGAGSPGTVAFGSVQPWISENFGRDWHTVPTGDPDSDELVGPILAMTFASADRFYVGTYSTPSRFPEMGIYRFDRAGSSFQRTRLDQQYFPVVGLTDLLPFDGSVTDIAIDWDDPSGRSIYVTFSGHGDFGHVWHYGGSNWQRRDGGNPGQPGSLLDVAHNAIVVDPEDPQTVYVGADIGVWRSRDGGQSWAPFEDGLPDAAVIDLKLHPRRFLRAATHGRGVFERPVDLAQVHHIELYIRDTSLDLGRHDTEDGLDNPLQKHTQVWHWRGPDIKLDFPNHGLPSNSGAYQFNAGQTPDFADFTGVLVDDGLSAGHSLEVGDEHHVYAQIHNRGRDIADGVRVTALITHATVGLPALPNGYEERVQQGQNISTDDWATIGRVTLDGVGARTPQIAHFVIPPDKLPPPSSLTGGFGYSILVLVHHPEDVYPVTPWQQSGSLQYRFIPPVDTICKTRRLAALKSVAQEPIVFEVREGETMVPVSFWVTGTPDSTEVPCFRFRMDGFPGRARLYIPRLGFKKRWKRKSKGFELHDDLSDFRRWARPYMPMLEKLSRIKPKAAPHPGWIKQRLLACKTIAQEGLVLEMAKTKNELVLDGLKIEEDDRHTFFLMLEVPTEIVKKGKLYRVEILQERKLGKKRHEVVGGLNFEVRCGDRRRR